MPRKSSVLISGDSLPTYEVALRRLRASHELELKELQWKHAEELKKLEMLYESKSAGNRHRR